MAFIFNILQSNLQFVIVSMWLLHSSFLFYPDWTSSFVHIASIKDILPLQTFTLIDGIGLILFEVKSVLR